MKLPLALASLAAVVTVFPSSFVNAQQAEDTMGATEGHIFVGNASLYSRVIGRGRPVIVLHGGPDFDHRYLLPELDLLKDAFRLIYYDQRGRGKSAAEVRPEDVTLASDLDDLDKVRQHFKLDRATLLGHSWGTVLALEYALRHPTRVSHLILMNPGRRPRVMLRCFGSPTWRSSVTGWMSNEKSHPAPPTKRETPRPSLRVIESTSPMP